MVSHGETSGARSSSGRQPAQLRVRQRARSLQSRKRGVAALGVPAHAPQRVVGGQVVGELERPVARLEREQLARGALERGARAAAAPRPRRCRSSPRARRRRCPRRAASPRSSGPSAAPGRGRERRARRARRGRARPAAWPARALRSAPRRAPPRATRGPSYHQWPSSSVSSAQQTSPGRPRSARVGVEPRDHPRHEVARVLARELQRVLVVVRLAAVVPRPQVVQGAPVVVAVAARATGSPPLPQTRLTVSQSIGTATGPGSVATGSSWSSEPCPSASVWSTQKHAHAVLGEVALEPGLVGALGQPEAAAPALAEAALVRGDAGAHLQPQRRRRWPASAARRGWPWRSTARRRASREGGRAGRGRGARTPRRARVVARRAAQLGGQLRLARGVEPVRVLGVDRRADLAQEAQEAVARLAAQRLELVAEHRASGSTVTGAPSSTSSSGR